MATQTKYGLLKIPYPVGWEPIGTPVVLSDGFMARAYQKGNEIVISYAGTTDENVMDWLTGNVPGARRWLAALSNFSVQHCCG